ncbi:restriction endonuclease subunit S [Corynebacterium sp. UMB0012]|uniref:restriction endonuclease subunit S n=1 Tax=Corynebacterium sp. UMB0012 TaxID=3046344 RepID=UPI00254DF0AA|nr:restriction endonuclease subunit S [Corynebacterium sp. UMB0012]MDK7047668.1 restriction endonuclease subunit S [Corynebacterium sp. UMB0012]
MTKSTRVRFLADLVTGYPFSSDDFSNEPRENDIPLARIRDIKSSEFTTFIDRNKVPDEVVIQNGDLVIGMDGDFNSTIWGKGPAALNQRMCLLRSSDSKTLRFISYAIPDQLQIINEFTYSTTVKHLSSEQILGLPLPDLDLQQRHAIADFLDRETAEIDGMRADLDAMERLLTERRAAIISEAVNVQYGQVLPGEEEKGIHKWIGSVPNEWPTAALWILGQRTNDKNDGLKEKNLLSLSHGSVIRKDIKDKTGLTPASYETYQIVEPGDIIFRFTDLQNDHRSLRSALVTERGIMTSAYINFRPDTSKVHPDFLAYFMRAMDQAKIFYEMGTGVRQTLNYEEFSRLEVPVPPLLTQLAMADLLDRETAEIDSMLSDITKLRDLLAERRAALISAVVTGQIDIPVSSTDKDEVHA